MTEVDRFFDTEIKAIASSAIARRAAEELYDDVRRQIRQNFRTTSSAFAKGIKIYEFDNASYVRLSPILSSHAQPTTMQGNPNIWILLPQGARLGFKRVGKGFNWNTLKRRYGTRLSFVPVGDGHVVLYRDWGRTYPIYKIQKAVTTKQRIEFYEKAHEIADRYGLDYTEKDRSAGFKHD